MKFMSTWSHRLFNAGLNPTCTDHKVKGIALLRLDLESLQKMGISEIEVKKEIEAYIDELHLECEYGSSWGRTLLI